MPKDYVLIIKNTNDQLKNIPDHPIIEESQECTGPKGNVHWTFTYSYKGEIVGEGGPVTKLAEAKRLAALQAVPQTEFLRDPGYLELARQGELDTPAVDRQGEVGTLAVGLRIILNLIDMTGIVIRAEIRSCVIDLSLRNLDGWQSGEQL
ncbi:hypothetical protein FRC19_009847 [Serendipita sp. 401]|nr:hypothetical protein FRC19_009847 [Serendipita sp. 401]